MDEEHGGGVYAVTEAACFCGAVIKDVAEVLVSLRRAHFRTWDRHFIIDIFGDFILQNRCYSSPTPLSL
jgi:hypothetical protein